MSDKEKNVTIGGASRTPGTAQQPNHPPALAAEVISDTDNNNDDPPQGEIETENVPEGPDPNPAIEVSRHFVETNAQNKHLTIY